MNTLAGKNIGVLINSHHRGDTNFADVVRMTLESYEPVGQVTGTTVYELWNSPELDVILTLDSVRDREIHIHPKNIVDTIRKRTGKVIPVVIYVSYKKNTPPILEVPGRESAFMFSESQYMSQAIRGALGLPQ